MNFKYLLLTCTLLISSQALLAKPLDDQPVDALEMAHAGINAFSRIGLVAIDQPGTTMIVRANGTIDLHKVSFAVVTYGLYMCYQESFGTGNDLRTQQLLIPEFSIEHKLSVMLEQPNGQRNEFPIHRQPF